MNSSKAALNTQKMFCVWPQRSYSGSLCCFWTRSDMLCEAGGKWCISFPSSREGTIGEHWGCLSMDLQGVVHEFKLSPAGSRIWWDKVEGESLSCRWTSPGLACPTIPSPEWRIVGPGQDFGEVRISLSIELTSHWRCGDVPSIWRNALESGHRGAALLVPLQSCHPVTCDCTSGWEVMILMRADTCCTCGISPWARSRKYEPIIAWWRVPTQCKAHSVCVCVCLNKISQIT